MSRKLGNSEKIFNQILNINGFNIIQAATIKGKINKKILSEALVILQEKFKQLQVGVVEINSLPYFKEIPNYKQRMLENFNMENKTKFTMKQIFDNEVSTGFKSFLEHPEGFKSGLLWKITLLMDESIDEFDLILCSSHMILDGKSICLVMGKLLEYIHFVKNEIRIEIGKVVYFCPPVEELIEKVEFKEEKEPREYLKVSYDNSIGNTYKQEIVLKKFSGEKLMKLCKEKKITVNSILFAAYFIGYVEAYFHSKDGEWIEIAVPYCLRNRTNFNPDSVGIFGTHVDFDIQWKDIYKEIKHQDIWNLAFEINENVKREIKKEKCIARVNPGNVPPNSKWTPALSNIGKIDDFFVEFDDYKVESLFTTVSAELGPVGMSHVATLRNQIYFAFTTSLSDDSKDRLKLSANRTVDILEKLISE
jgi:hypothetical protein